MATYNALYQFTTSDEGFTFTDGGNATGGRDATEQALFVNNPGRNKTDSHTFTKTFAFTDLGIPSGATVTGITAASIKSRVYEWFVVDALTIGDAVLTHGATTVVLAQSRSPTGTEGSYVTQNGVDNTSLDIPAANSVTITINGAADNGNNGDALVAYYVDDVAFTVTYSLANRTGTLAVTLDDLTGAIAGTRTVPASTGTLAGTLDDLTGAIAGTSSTPASTGTLAATLAGVTGAISGTRTVPASTGALAVTLAGVTGVVTGSSSVPASTGTLAVTLAGVTGAVTGSSAVPVYTGAAAVTLDGVSGTLVGTFTSLTNDRTGALAVTLAGVTGAIVGTRTVPTYSGAFAGQLDGVSGTLVGTFAVPTNDRTGSLAGTLDDVTGTMVGASTSPVAPPTGDFDTATVHTFGLRRFGVLTFGLGVRIAAAPPQTGGGGIAPYTRRITIPVRDDVPLTQLLREDEELIAVIIAAVYEGIHP